MIVIETKTVPEFMRAIVPTEPHFRDLPIVFRGQADANWGLVPSLWRVKSWIPLGGAAKHGLRVVGDLVEDDAARVRDGGQAVLRMLERAVSRTGVPTPAPTGGRISGMEALAQHIGLPTRLLDWTRSPLFAAYFAAADAVRLNLVNGHLVVYGMGRMFAENSHLMEGLEKPDIGGCGNPNLVAQQGRLICVDRDPPEPARDPPDLLKGIERKPVEAGARAVFPNGALVADHFAAVKLGHEAAPELVKVLLEQGIHAASMFPGHVGVCELVRELMRQG